MTPIRLVRWLAFVVISASLMYALAGRADIPRLWWWAITSWTVMFLALFLIDGETTRERLKRGHKTADPVVLALLRIFSLGAIVIGLLDVGRLHWSDTVPVGLSIVALAAMSVGYMFAFFAVRENRFFMPQVRIQSERGHQVVDSGPYRFVRHPGYAGMIVAAPASGLAIGSWLAFAIGIAAAATFAFRAFREDRFLQQNLEGYREYAARTRYRVAPGIW